jgi:lysophospholipase L1-like esterase
MHRRILLAVTAAVLCAVAAALPGVAAAKTAPPHYYLALGDSLSQGMQPDLNGTTLDTNQGYANDLLALERKHIHNLKLVQLGCGGDTTTSMLTGQGNNAAAKLLHCDRQGGSQEAAAEHFLKTHHRKGQVPLITVDIGANDVDGCATAADVISCVNSGLNTISTNLPKILAGLKKAAPKGTTFAGMTLYNPVLGGFFSPAGTATHTLALASTALLTEVNKDLTTADTNGGFLTADVADAFKSYDSTDTVSWQGQQIPVNVATLCSWTWACQTPPSGPNIHANKNGYQVIANAFAAAIGKRLH